MKNYGDSGFTLESIVPQEEEEGGVSWLSLIRVTLFLVSMFAGIGILYLVLMFAIPKGFDRLFDPFFQVFAYTWIFGITMYFWGAIEKKTLPQMGLIMRWQDLIAGIAIGFSAVLLLYGVELVVNLVSLSMPVSFPIFTILKVLVVTCGVALLEEIIFRGYILQTLMTDMPVPVAVGIATFLYAQIHCIKPGRTDFLLPFLGYLAAGLVLCYAFLLTRNLLLSMGLQGSWLLFMQFSDQLKLWKYSIPWLSGDGSPVCGLLGILTLAAIAGALRYVYGPIKFGGFSFRRTLSP